MLQSDQDAEFKGLMLCEALMGWELMRQNEWQQRVNQVNRQKEAPIRPAGMPWASGERRFSGRHRKPSHFWMQCQNRDMAIHPKDVN